MRRLTGLAHARPIDGRSGPYARLSACRPFRRGPRRPSALPAEIVVRTGRPAASFSRPCPFPDDVLRLLIGPKSEIDRLAQFPLAGPFRELHFGYQRRPDPSRGRFVLHFVRKAATASIVGSTLSIHGVSQRPPLAKIFCISMHR